MRGRHLSSREKQIIHVNEKHSMLAEETSRTRFKTRFRVSGNKRCKRWALCFFCVSPSSFCFRALQSGHLRTTRNSFSFFLFLFLRRCIEEACYSMPYNNAIYDESLLSWRILIFVRRDLNFSPKRRNENV